MSLRHDWDGLVELKAALWDEELRRRKLQAELPRTRSLRRRAGAWLMAAGSRLTFWGEQMAECEQGQPSTVTG